MRAHVEQDVNGKWWYVIPCPSRPSGLIRFSAPLTCCEYCRESFPRRGRLQRFCSDACAKDARRQDPVERFFSHVEKHPGGCWQWTANTLRGHGRFKHRGKQVFAHRFVYELFVAPIPVEMTIDHLCFNRGCVNPDHHEVVTRAENTRRGQLRRWQTHAAK